MWIRELDQGWLILEEVVKREEDGCKDEEKRRM